MSIKQGDKLDIQVWADWSGMRGPQMMGTLSSIMTRGKEIFLFDYSQTWLNSPFAQILDPALQLFKGSQFNNSQKENFGLFLDSAPDRWGRILQKRRASIQARKAKEKEPLLLESDYLLGVYDRHRLGALRFRKKSDGPFVNDDSEFSAPPFTHIRELEAASWAIENESSIKKSDEEKWIRMLIAPGGSLGGARPKASVLSEDGHLWIAKFPSREDVHDSGAWEYIVHQLAKKSGIEVPSAKAHIFGGTQHTFLLKRFDREQEKRIHFASAMTLLDKMDGDGAAEGSSYLELAEFIIREGGRVDQDLEQLWSRIVFYICVSNTDDHLRNHGFLLTSKGWILSPAYDMNPNPNGNGLKLNISEADNSQDFDLVLAMAPYFRLNQSQAEKIIKRIVSVVQDWRILARQMKISRANTQQMERAFRLVD